MHVLISTDGTVNYVYTDELNFLLQLGTASIRRASHVEPVGTEWTADMSPSGGPVLGPFPLRSDALDAEGAWLLANNNGKESL